MSRLAQHRCNMLPESKYIPPTYPNADSKTIELWRQYKKTGDRELRNRLIIQHMPLVNKIAFRMSIRLNNAVDQEDLAGYGTLGLIDAIDRFNLSQNIKFTTYASYRIKGAMIDEIRAIDWIPRSVRDKTEALERAYFDLECRLHRTPTYSEIAKELNISETTVRYMYGHYFVGDILPLDQIICIRDGPDKEEVTLEEIISYQKACKSSYLNDKELKRILIYEINHLGNREKIIIIFYYYEGFTLAEIGKILGVTESRICQIHTEIIQSLKSRLIFALKS